MITLPKQTYSEHRKRPMEIIRTRKETYSEYQKRPIQNEERQKMQSDIRKDYSAKRDLQYRGSDECCQLLILFFPAGLVVKSYEQYS